MKPSRFPVILNAVALLLNITASILFFLAISKPVFGWIWAGASVMWVFVVVAWVKTFRIQRRTAEMLNRRRP